MMLDLELTSAAGRWPIPQIQDLLGPPASARRGRKTRVVGIASAVLGFYLLAVGVLTAFYTYPTAYRTFFTGYEPPFGAVSGLLLLLLATRIAAGSRVATIIAFVSILLALGVALLNPSLPWVVAGVAAGLLASMFYRFRRQLARGEIVPHEVTQTAVLMGALLTLLYGLTGARAFGGSFNPVINTAAGTNWANALYYTVITMTTVGYGDIVPTSIGAKLFATSLALFGVATFITAAVVFFTPFLEERLRSVVRVLERAELRGLREHVVLCGSTPEIRALAETLRQRAIPMVILSRRPEVVQQYQAEGLPAYLGDGSSETVLNSAGIDQARAIVFGYDSDADNILAVLTARALVPSVRIVTMAQSMATIRKMERAGADEVISPVTVGARLMAEAALRTDGDSSPRG